MKRLLATCISALVGLATLLPAKGNAADLYVSSTGTYDGKEAYTDLQAAIDKAQTGDTVWVENGFVCDSGIAKWGTQPVRILISKAITVRSRTGGFENQPVIRGAIDSTGQDGVFGKGAVRGVVMSEPKSALIGFRIEGCAAVNGDGKAVNGGGLLTKGHVKSCVVVGNHAFQGGGISDLDYLPFIEDCIVTNNRSLDFGGGVFYATLKGSQIIGNRSGKTGGGYYYCAATNCLIANNVAAIGGGGCVGFAEKPIVGCVISNNTVLNGNGGGVSFSPNLIDSVVISNRAYGEASHGGGAQGHNGRALRTDFIGNRSLKTPGNPKASSGNGGGAAGITAVECRFIGNLTEGAGGGAGNCTLVDCLIQGNISSNSVNWGRGCGGGFANCHATNCLVIGNAALSPGVSSAGLGCGGGVDNDSKYTIVDCIVSNNVSDSRGGGIHYGTSFNCLVTGNTSRSMAGGGLFGGTHYNALVTGNVASNSAAGADWETTLVNCTVIGNKGPRDINYVVLVNTAVYGDGKDATGSVKSSTHSCAAFLTDKQGPGNIAANPKLGTEGAMRFVPQPGSPCIDAGLLQPWMTDAKSPGFRDRNGRQRVIGSGVDIGAFEAPFWGTRLFLR